MKNKKNICILGSTGSIGRTALEVISHLESDFTVTALAAHSNIELLARQALQFSAKVVAIYNESLALELKKRLPHCKVVAGMEGLVEIASLAEVDTLISAITGAVGILPTVAAIQAGKTIALANKEVLVAAGEYVMNLAKKHKATLIPVDSEHSAIFQCLSGKTVSEVSRIILTASGGPFHTLSREKLAHITLEQALKHPTWSMGPKITVDSSTLMNKGLEVIEAYHLFELSADHIDVVIHPQSIVHSMVEFIDGSILAQMSAPTMKVPIQYALTFPHRSKGLLAPFDFTKHPILEFKKPEKGKFICLDLAFIALNEGGSLPCYLNAANEVLVQRFLNKEIAWIDIANKLEKLCLSHNIVNDMTLDKVFSVDAMAREDAQIV
ncbi:MAG: 1-deoxy-D-xylulose-5-phosphate reductoisomerase [Chlamydiae bacterium]|nr:1-deoxy-D-xylulose-5-phosphate reductoisomerase [Chlamydiota bacterium]